MAMEEFKLSPKSYPMVGGDGPYSYAQNSSYQKGVVDASKEMIIESLADKLDFTSFDSNSFRIADLGCSVGPNTFTAVQNIIEAVEQKLNAENENPNKHLEFQVFFNDHTDNDFNTLFRSLPPSRRYFAAGVPGSFHGPLFPESSLHFVLSCFAVHWLSQVPKEVVNPKSAAWNKGSIHCTGYSKEVNEAYANQYKNDINSFLSARAEEVVNGGLMAIILCVIPNGVAMSHTSMGMVNDIIGSCLFDMAKLGVISEEKVDSFNLPLYFAPIMELEEAIKENGYFSMEKMSPLPDPPKKFSIQLSTTQMRASLEGLIKQHFGNEILDKLFECCAIKLADSFGNIHEKDSENINLFVLLKRKFD